MKLKIQYLHFFKPEEIKSDSVNCETCEYLDIKVGINHFMCNKKHTSFHISLIKKGSCERYEQLEQKRLI